jgi:hypothetical protein
MEALCQNSNIFAVVNIYKKIERKNRKKGKKRKES